MKETSLEYFEFDYKGKRHHTVELPVPLSIRLARFIHLSECHTYGCDDHGEIFCKKHGETEEGNLTPEVRAFIHKVIKEGRFS